jgi:antitoxin FitA
MSFIESSRHAPPLRGSLSDYLLQEVRRVAERPTLAELRHRLAQRPAVIPRVPPAKAVRAERERH